MLHKCTHITGSLTITVDENFPYTLFEPNLNAIQEIRGYLTIIGLPPKVKSINFMKNLRIIYGDELYADKYALFVLYNNDIEQLITSRYPIEVKRGSLFISMNAYLCNSKVLRFQHQISEVSGSCCDIVAMGNDEEC